MDDDESPTWPPGTVMCGICLAQPAQITWSDATPPMCSGDYRVYLWEQQPVTEEPPTQEPT